MFFYFFIFAELMKQTVLIFIVFQFIFFLQAQKNVIYDTEKGIEFIEQQYVEAWKRVKKLDGFRIQVVSFSGANSKVSVEKAASQFQQNFPSIPCYQSYLPPNFRLRAGNYRTKLDAYKALQKISSVFPGAFVLKEQIDFKND